MRVPRALLALSFAALFGSADLAVTVAGAAQPTSSEPTPSAHPEGVAAPSGSMPEKRIAFVVGDGAYAAGPLPTAANDAGLVAQTLEAAGFEVMGARDLDGETLRQSYADFLRRLAEAGPGAVAFVYLSGYGLQYGDSNYFVPVGAAVSGAVDIPVQSVRLSDLTGPLAALPLKARFAVFDAAYRAPFSVEGTTAGGFSLVDAAPGSLIAFNAAPGTVAPAGEKSFGLYALALATALREPGLPPEELFDRVRLRVSTDSGGVEVPWDVSKVGESFRFFESAATTPGAGAAEASHRSKAMMDAPLSELPVDAAFSAAVGRDSFEGYSAFVDAHADAPLAKRGRVLLAARREALTWAGAEAVDTPAAYWSYLGRYEVGPHALLARRRLAELSAAAVPPAGTEPVSFDVPPPPPDERPIIEDAPAELLDLASDLPAVPSPPAAWLPPLPAGFADLAAPPAAAGLFTLPTPVFLPLPSDVEPPPTVAFPAANGFFASSFGGAVPFGGNVAVGNRMVVNRIHRLTVGPEEAVSLPAPAQEREAALKRRGIVTATQLAALRARPGGVIGALGGPVAATSGTQAVAALESGRSVLTTDGAAAPAAVRGTEEVPDASEAPAANPAEATPPAARRRRFGEAMPKSTPALTSRSARSETRLRSSHPPRLTIANRTDGLKAEPEVPRPAAPFRIPPVAGRREERSAPARAPQEPARLASLARPEDRERVLRGGPYFDRPAVVAPVGPRFLRGGPLVRLVPRGMPLRIVPLRRFAAGPPIILAGRPLRGRPRFFVGAAPGIVAGGPPPGGFGGEYGGGFGSIYGGGFNGRF